MQTTKAFTHTSEGVLSTNRVLRNTYALLSATLLFSGVMAVVSMAVAPPPFVAMISTFGAIGILWLVLPKFENSASGVGIVFLVTGMLGFGLGPMLNYHAGMPNGGSLIATAMGGTGVIFLSLSAYVLTTRKSFDFLGGMVAVGMVVILGAILVSLFTQSTMLHIGISSGMILLMSAMILFDTGRIVNGGETNYIRATVSMFLNIFLLFTNLLQLLGIMGGDD
ncbi:MAG: Bax inhibitor-1 family protein [Granulosicoccus sp.]